ncbi:MAG: VCBS repeat-containing protein [Pirellulaceae bacterium]|nr:VCBS repeat-containing protein [Pirellulaceae bacterium]
MLKKGRSPRWLVRAGVGALFLGLLGIAVALWQRSRPPDPALLTAAGKALQENRPDEAFDLAQSYLVKAPQSAAARYLAAQAKQKRQRTGEALAILAEVSAEDNSEEAVACAILAGDICLELGRAWDAEEYYRQALLHAPKDVSANRKIASLLTIEGRRWESRTFLLELVSQRQSAMDELIELGDIWPDFKFEAELEKFREQQPQDPLPLLGLARITAHEKKITDATEMLRQVVKAYPDLVEAHAWLGWTLVQDRHGAAALAAWEKTLPPAAGDHPMIWLVRGLGAELLDQQEAAARCFWEALRRDPNYDLAAFRLSRALAVLEQTQAAKIVGQRAEVLLEVAATLKKVHTNRKSDLPTFRKLAEQMESLGRLREAWAWYHTIVLLDPAQAWASVEAERLSASSTGEPCLSLAAAEPNLTLDFSKYPLPKWPEAERPPVANVKPSASSPVRFIDSASAAGIDFTYFNGDEPGQPRLLGNLGGGVGILDYDGDLWPDIYFSQGSDWPVDSSSTTYRDRLYRNLGSGKFEDVTLAAGLGDNSYSHGMSVGDFDNDGFPDLYLANCGVNRLYHNNGDGTFTDITSPAGITSSEWTTSCLMADLSGDGLPDLYDVNYCEGDALTRRCINGPCGPHLFPAQQDRLLLNWGDGTFRDITRVSGINGKNGKGLGIVAADFALDGRLSLFIANDSTPNFFYDNISPRGDPVPRFSENGVLSGLAFDRKGLPLGSMGVAADDANGDGFVELYVTNFYSEGSTFYFSEIPGKAYSDLTAEFGLREGSLKMLGFGTQFIDGELDGWPDLIITNGHVQDDSEKGIPFKMRAQYYRNLAGEAFEELSPESLGPFFHQLNLGRGLARLDWNRDGREDVAISNSGSPAALLTNQTTPTGHFLALQLRGTAGSRDAIGAVARVKIGERTITRQLTAGDGYQASNQRQLLFGLGSAEKIDQLEIRWLSGAKQTFTDLSLNGQYIALEGRDSLVKLPSPR